MSARRLQLHNLLLTFCPNVYFQEPKNTSMQYPAIVYKGDDELRDHANNGTYSLNDGYELIVIDKDPDSPLRHKIRTLPKISFDRRYVGDGLNHFVYSLYY